MEIIPAQAADAPEISALLMRLSAPFYVSPDRRGADGFVAPPKPDAIARNIAAANFRYHVARHDGQLAGMAAMRDASHLFQLFVSESFQGHGLSRTLWTILRQEAETMASPPTLHRQRQPSGGGGLRPLWLRLRWPGTRSEWRGLPAHAVAAHDGLMGVLRQRPASEHAPLAVICDA